MTPTHKYSPTKKNLLQALSFGLGAFFIWALDDVITKFVGKTDASFIQMIWLASAGAVSFLVVTSATRGKLNRLKPNRLKLLCLMGGLAIFGSFINVITFTLLPLTTVYTALFSAPMITAVLAHFIIKEPLGRKQFVYIFLGFCGSLIAVNPLGADLNGASAWGWILLPAYPIYFAATTLFCRHLSHTETNECISIFSPAVRLLLFLPFVILGWTPINALQIGLMFGAGCLLGIGNLFFNAALSRTDAAVISPLHYSQLIWGAVFGFFLFGDIPAWHAYLGSAIIVASGIAGARLASNRELGLTIEATEV